MAGKIKHYFACANTSKGFKNFFSSNLQNIKKVFILKGGPGTGKSTLMKKIGNLYCAKDFDIEFIHCSSDPDSLDGVIIRGMGVAIVDGTSPHVIEPTAPGALEEYINLGVAWNTDELAKYTDEILYINRKIHPLYELTYKKLSEALDIHDEWESVYISNMSFKKANTLANDIIRTLLGTVSYPKQSVTYHRFFGGSTPKGALDYVENITEPLKKRYFLKGRPGSGKSTLLKKIQEAGEAKGLVTEVYHCGFDPDSLDMILFPELELCIFDSTAPHEYQVSRPSDTVIDLYSELINKDTDQKFSKKINNIKSRYAKCTFEAISYLKNAKQLHDQLEKFYIQNTDFSILDKIYDNLVERIDKLNK